MSTNTQIPELKFFVIHHWCECAPSLAGMSVGTPPPKGEERFVRKFSNFFNHGKRKLRLNLTVVAEIVCPAVTRLFEKSTLNKKEELTSPTRTKENRTEHRSQTTSYGNYYSKKKNKNISRKINQEQAHNVRGNVFIKRQKI